MARKDQTSLRARLRVDTRASHEELDEEVSRFDLTTPDGLSCFLQMQARALSALSRRPMSQLSGDLLHDLLARAEADLRQLGCSDREMPFELDALHPISIDYVIAGSRLGTQVLKKRWLSSERPTVRRATAYFSAPSYIETWAAFCKRAQGMPAVGPVADQIVRDADRIFQLYRECARALYTHRGAIHA